MYQLSCLLGLLLLIGCTSTDAIYKNYDRIVKTSDGVNAEEAKIMAQKQLIGFDEKRDYRITAPDIRTTPQALQYPDYWFVVFAHNWFSPISTDPLARTYTELRETQYLVVIDKKTGAIKFAGEWYPKRAPTFEWVFDSTYYYKDRPLALPPGEPSKKSAQSPDM